MRISDWSSYVCSSDLAERAIIAKQFQGKEVTFALGASVAASALSKFVGRAMVAPVADAFDSYLVALWGTCLFIVLSIICMLVYCVLALWEESWRQEPLRNDEEALTTEVQEHKQAPVEVKQKPRRRSRSISVKPLITQA